MAEKLSKQERFANVRVTVDTVAKELNRNEASPYSLSGLIQTEWVLREVKDRKELLTLSQIKSMVESKTSGAMKEYVETVWGEVFVKLLGNKSEYPNVTIADNPTVLRLHLTNVLNNRLHDLIYDANQLHDRYLVFTDTDNEPDSEKIIEVRNSIDFLREKIGTLLDLQ